jgi:beta-glucosidase
MAAEPKSSGGVTRRAAVGAFAGAALATAASASNGKSKKAAKPGFLWGTATAAHQIEGGNVNSDFWLAENVKPTLFQEPSADACDSYHRYGEDIALAARLGFNCHRFGIEWARIEPEPGMFSLAALDHYKRVLDECHKHGLAPMVTLSHWTVPRWFAARGGFEQADSPNTFARFAEQVARHLGQGMSYATTFNEANIQRMIALMIPNREAARMAVGAMYAACAKASGSDRFSMVLFGEVDKIEANMVAAHRKAAAALKAGPGSYPVGVTISMQEIEGIGADNKAAEVQAALYGPWLDAAKTADFVGVQTYTRYRVGPNGPLPLPADAVRTDAGYEFRPEALEATIRYAAKVTGKPVIVTENGIATMDDTRRVAFIDAALAGVARCMADGIDVRGYIHWSLLDNFEWVYGYKQHFGLVEVDRQTFKRTPKPSAVHLGKLARAGLAPQAVKRG